jgi:hypothetical protein
MSSQDTYDIIASVRSNSSVKVSVNYHYIHVLLAIIIVTFTGCSSTPKPTEEASKQSVSSTDEQIFVGDSVEMATTRMSL